MTATVRGEKVDLVVSPSKDERGLSRSGDAMRRLAFLVVVVAVAASLLAGCVPLTTRYWVAVEDKPGCSQDCGGKSVGVSPDGTKVYITGVSDFGATGNDFLTTAYRASDGARLWAVSFDRGADGPSGLVVSPDGAKVYVTGFSADSSGLTYTTVAYNAANGAQLWVARYAGPAGNDQASSLAVSADGTRLYVTGSSFADGVNNDFDYATVAYRTSDGVQLWVARFNYSSNIGAASIIGVSPDGTKVFVTGPTFTESDSDTATIAYSAANGTQLWVTRYSGGASGLGVSPDGTKVYVTGGGFTTVAFNAANGTQLWVAQYAGTPRNVSGLAVSPDGAKLYVTGSAYPTPSSESAVYTTVAYDTSAGSQLWVAISPHGDTPSGIAVSPDGTKVFITGQGLPPAGTGAVSEAYQAADGRGFGEDIYPTAIGGNALAVSPDGARVYVTGANFSSNRTLGSVTIAYNAVGVRDN